MENFKAGIRISRVFSTHREDVVRIEVHDDKNFVRILEVEIGLADFAELVTGSGAKGSGQFNMGAHERINKEKVILEMEIDYSEFEASLGDEISWDEKGKLAKKYSQDLCSEGWFVGQCGYGNTHRHVKDNIYTCSFYSFE